MLRILAVLCVFLGFAASQTTQGSFSGEILDSIDGHAVSGASVEFEHGETGLVRRARSGANGAFAVLSLPAGAYRIRVSAPGYQPQELGDYAVLVASLNYRSFLLRPLSDVWETREKRNLQALGNRAVLPRIGPDMGSGYDVSLATRQAGSEVEVAVLSTVVGRAQLGQLPIAGRDVYSLLIGLGGINSDSGSGRGLGLTVSGQRPSSSSFRLDGFESDNRLTTGPSVQLPPEAVDEYRVSLAQFSAEYGGTTGYLANAVTREAGGAWHGSAYAYARNDALDANSFKRNGAAAPRAVARGGQQGLGMGGSLSRAIGLSLFYESLRTREEGEPETIELPSTKYLVNTTVGSVARSLLDRFRAPFPVSVLPSVPVEFRPISRLRRGTGMLRTDQRTEGGAWRLFERLIVNRADQPDFIWTPYRDFESPLRQDALAAGAAAEWSQSPSVLHEFRAGYGYNSIGWPRPFPDIPTLTGFSSSGIPLALPGSTQAYGYRDRGRRWELGYTLTRIHLNHQWKAGAQAVFRRDAGSLTFGRDGQLIFGTLLNFYLDRPSNFYRAIDRSATTAQAPVYESQFRSRDAAFFVQDDWRVSPRLTLSAGIRYEYFGSPELMGGTKLTIIGLNPGALPGALGSAQLHSLSAGSTAYSSDPANFAGRAGAAWRLGAQGPVLRASYGIFYDRPFNNLWQNLRTNSVQLESFQLTNFPLPYLSPKASWLGQNAGERRDFPEPLLYQPGIRNPYSQNYLFGIGSNVGEFWHWEINHLGSFGRLLITTDRINRPGSATETPENTYGYLNPALGVIAYRANQGSSDFQGLNLVLRRRSQGLLLQTSYTWSHAIDNQSDPLLGDFFNLSFTSNTLTDSSRARAAFSRQYDSRGDRGNSDFDQRHNLVVMGSWQTPASGELPGHLLGGWTFSWLATVRSGQPFTVFVPPSTDGPNLYNRRADYLGGPVRADGSVAGGVQWLNPQAFASPASGLQGNLGRNSLRAPGFYSADCALSRSLRIPRAGETWSLTLRAEVFNLLNHSNLDRPVNDLADGAFGVALYGRHGSQPSFPAMAPLDETPRRIRLGIQIAF